MSSPPPDRVSGAGLPPEGGRLRAVRSFVRREGRITPAQKSALERLWPRYGADFDGSLPPLHELFGRQAPVCVEIGFGAGDHLLAAAQARPDTDFLGIEVHRPGVGRLLHRAAEAGLGNLRVACADAMEVLRDGIAAGSVDQIVILFPDPWPKKRHHKRRLIQPEFVRLLARALRPGGRLLLATDWEDYAHHMLQVLNAEAALRNAAGEGFAQRPAARAQTRFEARGLRLGHAVFELEFVRR